jgi:hypothetical protein
VKLTDQSFPCDQVAAVNPGFFRTEIQSKAAASVQDVWDRLPEQTQREYGDQYMKGCEQAMEGVIRDFASDPVHVINVSAHAFGRGVRFCDQSLIVSGSEMLVGLFRAFRTCDGLISWIYADRPWSMRC